jgi:glycerol-3-phosphate acyltransferase PlsY
MLSIVSIIMFVIAYLIGSIPSAVLICKFIKLPDPREGGSRNPGTTNVFRIAGKWPAVFVFIADALKGFIPVILAASVGMYGFMLAAVLLIAVIGHMFPIFSKFRGGKGMATAFGGILFLTPKIAILAIIVWLVIVVATRYVSLASIIAVILAPVLILFAQTNYFVPIAIMSALILWRHLPNIQRLKMGTESQIDLKKFKEPHA